MEPAGTSGGRRPRALCTTATAGRDDRVELVLHVALDDYQRFGRVAVEQAVGIIFGFRTSRQATCTHHVGNRAKSSRPTGGFPLSVGEYFRQNWIDIVNDGIRHVDLTIGAMAIAVVLGVGLGVITYTRPTFASLATTTTAAFLTIPSLALLGILIGPFGLGTTPVVVALVLYALLPITRNTIVGLQGVDRSVVGAAEGMGLGRLRLLLRVRLPLAWPVMLSGIRVSTQLTVGIATIGAYVKGPGLGNQIFAGLGRFGSANSLNQVLIGTIGVMIVALLLDLGYVAIGRLTISRGIRGT